jgi:hypothetical protein
VPTHDGSQFGAIAASRKLSPLRHKVETELAEVLVVFTAIDSETVELPIGEVRQQRNARTIGWGTLGGPG